MAGKILARLGYPSDCIVSYAFNTTVKLTINSQLSSDKNAFVVGSKISFLDNVIWNRNAPASNTTTGSFIIAGPTNIPLPVVTIQVISITGSCAPLNIQELVTTGNAGRSWSSVSITFNSSTSDSGDAALSLLLSQSASLSSLSQNIYINQSFLSIRTYQFNFVFKNCKILFVLFYIRARWSIEYK